MIADRRPCPADFAEQHAKLTRREIIAHYGTSPRCLARWKAELGLASRPANNIKPLPADFAAVAASMPGDAVRRHYRISVDTLKRWRKEASVTSIVKGKVRQKCQPHPDFTRLAPTMTLDEAAMRFGRKKTTLRRWEEETGVRMKRQTERTKRPMPADFVARHAEMPIVALARHYRSSTDVVTRWAEEAGVKRAIRQRIKVSQPFVRSAPERPIKPLKLKASFAPVDRARRDASRAGQAADYLRRFGPVVRCDERGRYAENGTHWRRGSTVLNAADVIERAERNGWQPDAWKLVA